MPFSLSLFPVGPIYVTSASELNSSQSALQRTTASSGAPAEESQAEEEILGKPSPARSTTSSRAAVSSSGPDLSPSKTSSNNVTVVGVNSTSASTTIGGREFLIGIITIKVAI